MDEEYSNLEISVASAWAAGNFSVWLKDNPSSDVETRAKVLLNYFEGGLYLGGQFSGRFPKD